MGSQNESHTSYLFIFGLLIVLTIVTVAIAYVDLGSFNIVLAMMVASVKAYLVAVHFMHLKFEDSMTRFYALVPIVLLVIMIGGVFLDNPYRIDPRNPEIVAKEKMREKLKIESLNKDNKAHH
jgi:cytochrome c oxidase subunit 4